MPARTIKNVDLARTSDNSEKNGTEVDQSKIKEGPDRSADQQNEIIGPRRTNWC